MKRVNQRRPHPVESFHVFNFADNLTEKLLIPRENPLVAAVILKSIVPSLVTLKLIGTASYVGRWFALGVVQAVKVS